MSKSMKIGLDLDGVIIDHTSSRIFKARELGYSVMPAQTPTHNIKTLLKPEHYKELQNYIYGPASLFTPKMSGALENIAKLSKENEIFIISRRDIEKGGNKLGLEWLKKNRFMKYIPKENIFFVPHEKYGAKNIAVKKLDIEIYLDDQLRILEEIPHARHRVLFDQHNVFSPPPPYKKVVSWPEFYGFIEKLK